MFTLHVATLLYLANSELSCSNIASKASAVASCCARCCSVTPRQATFLWFLDYFLLTQSCPCVWIFQTSQYIPIEKVSVAGILTSATNALCIRCIVVNCVEPVLCCVLSCKHWHTHNHGRIRKPKAPNMINNSSSFCSESRFSTRHKTVW